MKLPGRTPVLIDLDPSEYNALSKIADEQKVSMTVIVRDLIRQNLMKEDLLPASFLGLSKRTIRAESEKKALVVHFADDEHASLMKASERSGKPVTTVVRNLIRTKLMGVGEIEAST